MQLGHTVCARPLSAHHHDHISVQLTRCKRVVYGGLRTENTGLCSDAVMRRVDR